ncbi:cytochrome C oxidase subunit IV family protein [Hymenobacter caeli]|uniref:Cytochrome c oxidase subunit IV n=1 Tax=Hymenobacter caeli TaxID=2735894 RepID=A0ABX2FPI9_9BACT|nr:cytochrome C oxidase subunit IV family protein [Hymenobacter caeli]NRT19093.1 cytochrome c oxidase subunit IV [Hymenobacter caeli]
MSSPAATDHATLNGEIAKPNTSWIWRVFFVLVAITAVEFAITFALEAQHFRTLRNSILIGLTILKAFFIVGEFMHLKHETKGLIWMILVPSTLLIWLLVALVTEGSFIGETMAHMFS